MSAMFDLRWLDESEKRNVEPKQATESFKEDNWKRSFYSEDFQTRG